MDLKIILHAQKVHLASTMVDWRLLLNVSSWIVFFLSNSCFLFLDSIEAQLCESAADASANRRSIPSQLDFTEGEDGPADLADHQDAPYRPQTRRQENRQRVTGQGGSRDQGASRWGREREREGLHSSASAWSDWSVTSSTSSAQAPSLSTSGGHPPIPPPPGWVAGVNVPVRKSSVPNWIV